MKRVVVMGQGYVGLPLSIRAAEVGYTVVGFDPDQNKIDSLRRGESYVEDVHPDRIKAVLRSGKYAPASNPEYLKNFDMVVITVPTPLRKGAPDTSYIESATAMAGKYLRAGAAVVLESTTYPGTTDTLVADILFECSGLKPEDDYFLGFSPERIDPGNKQYDFQSTPKLVSGMGPKSLAIIQEFYEYICNQVIPVSHPRVAELAKILENTFRQVNIALINEMAQHAYDMSIDIWEVVTAASTKPYGFMPFYPGPGVGGHCYAEGGIVLTEFGPRAIETITPGTRVITADGQLHPVLEVFSHEYSGDLTVVKAMGAPPIRFTPDHEFYVSEDLRANYGSSSWVEHTISGEVNYSALSEITKVSAQDLVADSHYMFFPNIQENISIAAPPYANDDYVKILGWYASEGSIFYKNGKIRGISFGLNTNELEYHEEIRTLLPNVSGNSHVSEIIYPENNSHVLKSYTSSFAEQIEADCGRYQHDRFTPQWILFGEEKWIYLYLRGLFCGDGTLSSIEAELTTTSINLAYGTVILLNRIGITSSVAVRNRKNRRTAFEISVTGSTQLRALYDIIGVDIEVKATKSIITRPKRDNKIYGRIRSVSTESYTGKVYDLHVEDNHTYLTPGGIVSNCLPCDPVYMASRVKSELGKTFHFVELAQDINDHMPDYVVSRASDLLNDHSKSIRGSKILILGRAYKANTSDIRESPAERAIELLTSKGADVTVYDPHVSDCMSEPESYSDFDLVILVTDHERYNYVRINQESALILDTRHKFDSAAHIHYL